MPRRGPTRGRRKDEKAAERLGLAPAACENTRHMRVRTRKLIPGQVAEWFKAAVLKTAEG